MAKFLGIDDFESLVKAAHQRCLRVIMHQRGDAPISVAQKPFKVHFSEEEQMLIADYFGVWLDGFLVARRRMVKA